MQAAIVVQVILLISICVDVALILVLFGAPHKRLTHRLLITNLIGIIGWALGIVLVLQYETMRAVQLAFISPLVIAVSQYWFVHVYPNRRFGTLYECWFLVPALACLMVLLYAPETVVSSFTVVDGYYIRADNGRWAPCYSFFVTMLLLYAPLHLYRVARFMPSGIERVRTRQLAVATGIFFLVGVLINSVLPVFLHVYFLNGLGPVFSLILSAYLVYVVRRYRFLDVKLVIQRGVMYVLLLMSVIVVFLLSMLIAGQLFGAPINSMSALTALMATVIVILAYPHLDAHLRQVTNRLFFKKQYDLVEAMNSLASIVRERLDLHEVLHTTAKHLHDIFNVPWVCCLTQAYSTTSDVTGGGLPWLNAPERVRMFALFAGHTSPISLHRAGESEDLRVAYEYLSAQDVELVVPVCDQHASLTALLVFPIKKSGDTFTGPDVALLSAFAKQLAGSLEKAMLYETEKQHARNLERTVEERTKELRATQEQQRHMMIDISHNMQTPLTILRGQIELLRATASDPETLETVVRSIDRLSAFVYDLLTLSRLDRTDLPFAGAELSLSDLVEDVAELFAVSAEEDGVTLTTVVTPGISLLGERDRVRDLITNLLSNAQKYLKQTGERRITLTLEREGAEAVIRMSDTGIGIRKEDVPRIFDRFFRVGESGAKGTGLGLAICKRIVERHGGTLEVASTHGVGSVFTARFPCTRSTQ